MKWLNLLALLASAMSIPVAFGQYTVPPGSPGYLLGSSTQAIQFDSHSLLIDGKRVFIWSGEFHPWRLPVPQLWSDVLQKMKGAGFNAVSIYIHWGLTEGKPGSLDWNYYRSISQFYEVAKEVGIYVIARPGPYINAETSGGGLPGWLTTIGAVARTNQTGFVNAWQSYVKQFSETTAKYQYPDGPVIFVQSENEFYVSQAMNPTASQAMALLETAFRQNGISKVPLTCNDVWPSGNFASGLGQVDIYGFDSYPGGFDCSNPSVMPELPNYYVSAHASADPYGFMYLAEYQGGAFDPWQGPGYDGCEELLGSDYSNVFYKNNVASGATAMSFYMTYGGTNWGNIAEPAVYTSYDYGAAIREPRTLSAKYSEQKLQGLFYHSAPALLTASIVGSGAGAPFASNAGVFTTKLGGGGNPTNFYILRQMSNNITTPISTSLTIDTSVGSLKVPQFGGTITLAGRESKILVSEYKFGNSVLRYSTAEVMTQTTIDGNDIVVLYVLAGQNVEAVVPSTATAVTVTGSSSIKAKISNNDAIITGTASGISAVQFGKTTVIVADKATAFTFWNPRTQTSYDVSPSVPSVLVVGPYLVRNASISSTTLSLVGDTNGTTPLTVIAPAAVKSVKWNGESVKVSKSSLGIGLSASLTKNAKTPSLPNLKNAKWKSADSLPEIAPSFDDSTWVTANKTTTLNPFPPFSGKIVLFADEYGFHSGSFVYRGYFTGKATGVNLSLEGGNNFGYSAYLNGQFLKSNQGFFGAVQINDTLTFPANAVVSGKNVLTIVTDSSGLNEDWNSNDDFKHPRGIVGYQLVGGGDFDTWKLTGNFGGESFPDNVRGPLNEGGFWAERSGAVLPGFDDSKWQSATPFTGISKAGIQVYRTKFTLSVADGVDAPLAFKFTATPTSNYRSLLYVNGWQFGKFISNFGPQTVFPVPEGILNHKGENEIALTLWSLDAQGAKIADLELVALGAFASGKEVVTGLVTSPTFQQLRT